MMTQRLFFILHGVIVGATQLVGPNTRAMASLPDPAVATEASNVPGSADAAVVSHEQQLLEAGYDLRRQGKDSDALAVYREAYALRHDARPLAQVALALEALGEWSLAYPTLQQALANAHHPWIQANRSLLESELKRIDQHLGRLTLIIEPQGASVRINGAPPSPASVDQALLLNPGWNVVEVSLNGYTPYRREIEIAAGKEFHDLIRLTPLSAQPVRSGTAAAAIAPNDVVMSSRQNPWWLGGVAGGLLLASTALIPWSIANGKIDQLAQDCKVNPRCPVGAASSDVQRLDRTTNALLFSGLGIAATSAVLYFALPQSVPTRDAGVSAWANHDGAFVSYRAFY